MKLTVSLACFLCFHLSLNAQLCAGSLGDPIVNVTFSSGRGSPEIGRTDYEFVGGCPSKGQYTIDHFLFGCGNNTWVAQIGDHTHDQDGNYMLVNSAGRSGTVHIDTATGLCGNTTYQFAAWVTNVLQDFSCDGQYDLANLLFSVRTLSGELIASYNSGFLPLESTRTWTQYGFCFQTPSDVNTVVLVIQSRVGRGTGCGSAFAIDDITLNVCGPSINITLDGSDQEAQVCADYTNPFVLSATYSAGFTDPVLQWQSSADTGRTWINIAGANTTVYAIPRRTVGPATYRILISERGNVGSLNCSIASNTLFTYVHETRPHRETQTINGCTGKDLLLPNADPESVDMIWTGPRGFIDDKKSSVLPNVQYADTGLYTLKETFLFGCTVLDSVYLKVYPGTSVIITPSYPVCEGMSETLSVSATDPVRYQWTPSTGLSNDTIPSPVARPVDSTIYKIVTTNEYGCKDSAYLPVNVYRLPVANAGPDKAIIKGDTAVLNGAVSGTAVTYSWSPADFINDSQLKQPFVSPLSNTVYTLNVVSAVGCGSVSDNVTVKVYNDLFIPSAFTPNNDGKNDRFRIASFDNYTVKAFSIYNRWGQIVYQTKNTDEGWDGTINGEPQPEGVYIYYLEIQSPLKKTITKKGTITLIR